MHTPIKLFIGLPIYAQVPAFFLQSLLALQAKLRTGLRTPDGREIVIGDIRMSQGDGVARSRNQLSADFIASDCTHLLFIDCDLIFSAEQVARIVSHDLPLVGGLYPKKQEGPVEWVLNTLGHSAPDQRGLQAVRYIGTGFLCIQRLVFERMLLKYGPEIQFEADYGKRRTEHDFWPMGVYEYPDGHRRYLSEDWYFCQRWNDLGGTVLADTRVIVKHLGPAVFPLASQEQDIFRAAIAAGDFVDEPFQPDCQPVAPGGRAGLCIGRPASSPVVPQTALANERV